MGNESRGIGLVQVVWILAGLLVAVAAGFHIFHSVRGSSVPFSTPYQAVLLTNGSVYFGHLQDYGSFSSCPNRCVLRRESNEPETKQVKQCTRQARQGTARTRPHVHQPEPDCFCGDGGHKLNGCPAHSLGKNPASIIAHQLINSELPRRQTIDDFAAHVGWDDQGQRTSKVGTIRLRSFPHPVRDPPHGTGRRAATPFSSNSMQKLRIRQ